MEIRIRRVTRDKYDIVLLRDDSVSVSHEVTLEYAMHWLKCQLGYRMFELKVGGRISVQSIVEFT